MNRQVFDIETLADVSTFTFENYDTGQVRVFEFSRYQNDYLPLKEFWYTITHLISFNGNHFDNPVTQWLLDDRYIGSWLYTQNYRHSVDTLSGEQLAKIAYWRAQQIIHNQEIDRNLRMEVYQLQREAHFISIDLFLFWSKMLRLSKKLSLKFFAHNLGMNIVEMPIHHSTLNLSKVQIQQVRAYNLQDVRVTSRLARELKEQINLRSWIQKTYGLSCYSMDSPKIAQQLILVDYCQRTKKSRKIVSKRRYVKPNPLPLADLLPEVIFKTPFFQQVYLDMLQSVNGFERKYLYRNPDGTYLKLSYGIGGLHTIQKNETFKASPFLKIKTIDVASLYPTLILNYGYITPELGVELLRVYGNIKVERLLAKQAGEKQKDTLMKLMLNGFSGLADSPTCWLYSPEQILAMRLHGQLLLSRVLEELGLAGLNAISLNTDGVELRIRPDQQALLDSIIKQIEQEFGVEFEQDAYKAVYYKTVNDYLAIYETPKVKKDGTVETHKAKGEFIANMVLDGSNEFLIVSKAVEAYFVHGKQPEQFITKHKSVFDFCAAKKISKDYQVYFRGKKQQQLNRYLVSTNSKGAYLYKQKGAGANMENVLKGLPVILVNEECNRPPADYPIDYQWYIQRTRETIRIFEPPQLSLFEQSVAA